MKNNLQFQNPLPISKVLILLPALALGIAMALIVSNGLILASSEKESIAPGPIFTGWITSTIAGGSPGPDRSLDLDAAGSPHIAYHEEDSGALLYAFMVDHAWVTQTVDTEGINPSLALDTNGYPHIGYQKLSRLGYAYWDGTQWITQTVDQASGSNISLALDGNNYPRMTYGDGSTLSLVYAYWSGSDWYTETFGVLGGSLASSIAIDELDNSHIFYYQDSSLKYAHWTGSAWEHDIVDNDGDVGFSPAVALDQNNRPHVVYRQYDPQMIKYAYWTGTDWDIQVISGTVGMGYYNTIALDNQDNPTLCGWSMVGDKLKCFTKDNASWNEEFVDSRALGFLTLAIDQNQKPHLLYLKSTPFGHKVMYATKNVYQYLPLILKP